MLAVSSPPLLLREYRYQTNMTDNINQTTPEPTPSTSFNSEEPQPIQNLCVCCGCDMGPENPRQFCRKTYCDDECRTCGEYCGGYCKG